MKRIISIFLGYFFNIWRIRNGCYKFKKFPFIYRIFKYSYYRQLNKFGSYVDLNTNFISIPLFPHDLHGIFISGGSTIGKDCIIYHHVTIGSNNLKDSKGMGAPTIGNNVLIGAGAKIIGNVKIGDHCRIGANCTVTTNMPSNSIAVSQPSRIIQKENLRNIFTKKEGEQILSWIDGKWATSK